MQLQPGFLFHYAHKIVWFRVVELPGIEIPAHAWVEGLFAHNIFELLQEYGAHAVGGRAISGIGIVMVGMLAEGLL